MSERRCSQRDCGGVLLREWGSFRWCPTCRETAAKRAKAYRATERGKAVQRASKRAQYLRHGAAENEARKADRLARKLRAVCTWCQQPAADDSDFCARHRDAHRASALAYYHRTKANKRAA